MIEYNIALLLALVVSTVFNIGLLWYNRQLVARLLYVSENLNDLVLFVETYKKHLMALYETEMYYGDETMKHLISHTVSFKNMLDDYEDIVDLTEPLVLGPLNNEDNEIEENETDIQPEKDVFYGGARKSNN